MTVEVKCVKELPLNFSYLYVTMNFLRADSNGDCHLMMFSLTLQDLIRIENTQFFLLDQKKLKPGVVFFFLCAFSCKSYFPHLIFPQAFEEEDIFCGIF